MVLADYNGSMMRGAMDVFPDIGLSSSSYRQFGTYNKKEERDCSSK